jgi:hypothetical protein
MLLCGLSSQVQIISTPSSAPEASSSYRKRTRIKVSVRPTSSNGRCMMRTFWTPSDDVDSTRVFSECAEVLSPRTLFSLCGGWIGRMNEPYLKVSRQRRIYHLHLCAIGTRLTWTCVRPSSVGHGALRRTRMSSLEVTRIDWLCCMPFYFKSFDDHCSRL